MPFYRYDDYRLQQSWRTTLISSFNSKFCRICLPICALSLLVYYYFYNYHPPETDQLFRDYKEDAHHEDKNVLKILLWTTDKYGSSLFYGLEEFLKLKDGHCPATCQVTTDKKLIDVADAVAFAGVYSECPDCQMPLQNKRNQIRVFFSMESPQSPNFRRLPNVYNWTLSYRRDSDVPIFYGAYRPKSNVTVSTKETEQIASHSEIISSEKLDQLKLLHLDSNKTKLIAWIVSHCKTGSEREKLAKKLAQFLPVDIYGGCGSLKCPNKRMDSGWQSCYKKLGQEYKFYLSFENTLCWDYVTEKLFEPLDYGMVPIVYGGANYSEIAPPGSFIDALAFPSVQKLADTIKFLDGHPEEYLKYFLWRDKYEIHKPVEDDNWWCELCKKLWQHSVVDEKGQRTIDPQYSKVNDDISRWWLTVNRKSKNGSVSALSPACRLPPNSQ